MERREYAAPKLERWMLTADTSLMALDVADETGNNDVATVWVSGWTPWV